LRREKGRKERERGKERGKTKETEENTRLPEINFWLRSYINNSALCPRASTTSDEKTQPTASPRDDSARTERRPSRDLNNQCRLSRRQRWTECSARPGGWRAGRSVK